MNKATNAGKGLLMFLLMITAMQLKAQEKHFIYMQSENKQPFYVQVNSQTFSSSANGYIIIPQLAEGKYSLLTGFAQNQVPEQKFTVEIPANVAGFGYSLKQFGEKGWGLFDIINFNTIMADRAEPAKAKEDAIAVVPKPQPEAKEKPAETKAVMPEPKKETKTIGVAKIFEKSGPAGFDQVYTDNSGGQADTITLFIPRTTPAVKEQKSENKEAKKDTVKQATAKLAPKKRCPVAATEEDFYRTRLSMAAASSDERMMQAGKDAFAVKCYSVEQVKNLGVLFLSDKSRYYFFAMARPAIADPENYATLESQFKQAAVIEQFRSLLKTPN